VGGPDYYDNFYDIRDDYRQTEVALDYNAPYQSLLAYQISVNAADPPYVNITQDRPIIIAVEEEPFAAWKIAVIVVVIVLALVGSALAFWRWKRRRNNQNKMKNLGKQELPSSIED
jgi:endoglucanase